jgi:hypothetical protein
MGGKSRSFFDPLSGPDWAPEEGVQAYLESGLKGSFADYPQGRRFFSRPEPTPLDQDMDEVIEFLEEQVSNQQFVGDPPGIFCHWYGRVCPLQHEMESIVTELSDVSKIGRQVIAEVERAVVGKRDLLEMMMASVLAGGHILLEDFPGLGKTLVARSFATALGLQFKRIQFTPDLLPGDITGGYIFNRTKNKFELRKGPVFANIILADEINRASPKTQSALLEAMQEGQVTIEGETLRLPQPFLVLATQNPIEYEGTFPLPEAQLDRFMLKLKVGLPEHRG